MSPGQTGRTPAGVPPKFFMFIGFFLSPFASSSGGKQRMGDRFLSSAGTGKRIALSPRGCRTPAQHWIKIVHPWVQKFYPVRGLGSGGRLIRGFQTPILSKNQPEVFLHKVSLTPTGVMDVRAFGSRTSAPKLDFPAF